MTTHVAVLEAEGTLSNSVRCQGGRSIDDDWNVQLESLRELLYDACQCASAVNLKRVP